MSKLKSISDVLNSLKGVKLATVDACIKNNKHGPKDDVLLVKLRDDTTTAATFTQNKFCAAPVKIAKQNLLARKPSALIINSGNANAGTGKSGMEICQKIVVALAEQLGCDSDQILPFSTGVIGEQLPVDRIIAVLPKTVGQLTDARERLWIKAAETIMTTDSEYKLFSEQLIIDGVKINLIGIAKGSGMVHPNMATMLAFVFTDIAIESSVCQSMLNQAVAISFNCISVDGDTSTNDACVLCATGAAKVPIINSVTTNNAKKFKIALNKLMQSLAKSIVKDGEGATKCVEIIIDYALTEQEAKHVAELIAKSPLVKTALFAEDPNWGRILMAIGNCNIDNLDTNKIEIYFDELLIFKNEEQALSYDEDKAADILSQPEFTLRIVLNRGNSCIKYWTTDLSYDYIKINSEYRT